MCKKNKLFKLAGILILIGLILSIIGFLTGGSMGVLWKNGKFIIANNEKIEITKDLNQFKTIDLDIAFATLEVVKSDKYAIELSYFGEGEEIVYKVENEKLIVKDQKRGMSIINMNLNLGPLNNVVRIYIPQDTKLDDININNSSGNIKVSNINSKKINLICDFGDIELENLNSDLIDIKVKTGDINLDNIDTDKLIMNSDFGTVKGTKIDSNELCAIAKAGNINLDGTLKGNNIIKNDFGNVNIKTSLSKKDYSYNIEMDFGSWNIDGKKYDADYINENNSSENKFDVKCKSGNFNLE